ncbi:hypothetical protein [Lusitaniella coriacea]|uniref:hypothetical protein n=1 Tax=Lusitaniella coriacea TaxID=1983105 RepID=UPI003CF9280F
MQKKRARSQNSSHAENGVSDSRPNVIPFLNKLLLQIKNFIPVLALSYALIFGVLASSAILSTYYDIPFEKLTRDPTAIIGVNPFVGFFSNIGILFWCSTSAICLFSSMIYRRNIRKKRLQFLISSGVLTLFLLLDDLFLLHERIFPGYLNISEEIVYVGYLSIVSLYFFKFRKEIIKTEYALLLVACGLFALSISVDLYPSFLSQNWEFLVEDGFKLLGIVTWFIFFVRTCLSQNQESANI